MPIIVESSPSAEQLIAVTGARAELVATLEDLRRRLTEVPDEHAVILGPSVGLEAATALADTLRVTQPAVSVILIRRRVDTTVLVEAIRSGMREVIDERDLTGLGEAIRRAQQVYQAVTGPSREGLNPRTGKLITVFSPKGGVGKTTIATNLAVVLAARGNVRTCLVDLDLLFGDVAITLQLHPVRTMSDVVAVQDQLDFSVLEPLLTPHRCGFTTLLAPLEPYAKDALPTTLIPRVLSMLKLNFDFVVVDTSPAFDEHVLQAFDETDQLLLVTTLDVATLKNVKIASETLDLLNISIPRRHLVLNRADDRVGITAEQVETTLDMKVAQAIPTSPQVASATNAGEPITASHPRHPVSQAIARLASSLVDGDGDGRGAEVEVGIGAMPPRGGARTLLRRRGRRP